MKNILWKRMLIIAIVLAVVLGILRFFTTGIPIGKAVLTYKGTQVTLTAEESFRMRWILSWKFYDYGIGGCPFREDISISFGNTVYAIACDGCASAKDWNNERYFIFNREEFEQIAALFEKYCDKTLIY